MKTATATITAAFAALLTGVSGRTHDTIKCGQNYQNLDNFARDSTVSKFLRLAKVFPTAGCFDLFALQVRAKEL